MAKYAVDLTAPPGHSIPPLLQEFGAWLAEQEHGSLGWFDSLQAESVPEEWDPKSADRLQRDGFSFLHLPDGSLLVLLETGAKGPPAVVLLGSEGETATVASSLEEFLALLSRGETGINDLDEEEAEGRPKLRAWLSEHKVKASKTKRFDFDAYLHGPAPAAAPAAAASSAPVPEVVAGMTPFIRKVVTLVGRRADDPELVDFVTQTLGKKVPDSTTPANDSKNVEAKKHGLEMNFSHDLMNEKYPPIKKSKSAYVPYLGLVWLREKLPEPLPFDLKFRMTAEELTSRLGQPGDVGFGPCWRRVLDPARDIVLTAEPHEVRIEVAVAYELASPTRPGRSALGVFIAWAILRDLIDTARFCEHAALLNAIRQRERQGSALVDPALPRGLWDVHLKDVPGLRQFAYQWFHNIGGRYIPDDLVAVFGARKGKTGHDEPVLDDDNWQAVDKVAPALDKRFAQWVTKQPADAGQ